MNEIKRLTKGLLINKTAKIILLIQILITATLLNATTDNADVWFLLIDPSAKAIAMGNSYASVSDDAISMFYNAGGIGLQKKKSVQATYSTWNAGVKIQSGFVGIAIPSKIGSFGGMLLMHATDFYTGIASGISYASCFGEKISVGMTVKMVMESYALLTNNSRSNGFSVACDLGMIYTFMKNTTAGLSINNLGPRINVIYGDTLSLSEELPIVARMGIKHNIMKIDDNSLFVTSDLKKVFADFNISQNDDDEDTASVKFNSEIKDIWIGIGSELMLNDIIFLRLGYLYNNYMEVSGFSYGAGVKVYNTALNVSYDPEINKSFRFQLDFYF